MPDFYKHAVNWLLNIKGYWYIMYLDAFQFTIHDILEGPQINHKLVELLRCNPIRWEEWLKKNCAMLHFVGVITTFRTAGFFR